MNGTSGTLQEPFGPKTARTIGRKKYINAIRSAIADETRRSYVLYFVGDGGIGKTRLLEEVEVIKKEWIGTPFLWSDIIDLYHNEYHSPGGLRKAIADGLDIENLHFRQFRDLREEYEKKKQEGVTGSELDALWTELDRKFQEEFRALADKYRIALCFDTMELVQYESDIVQKICRAQHIGTDIRNWLLKQVSVFPNTVTIFAGRPRPDVQKEFKHKFAKAGINFELYEVGALTDDEVREYLDALTREHPELLEILTPDIRRRVLDIARGRPIFITLLIDLMLHGESLAEIFPVSGSAKRRVDEKTISVRLGEHLLSMPNPFDQMVYFLLHARKGLDADLLRHLAPPQWSDTEIETNLNRMREFAFVKIRPKTNQLFLHDAVYDLFDCYFQHDMRVGSGYKSIAQYYRQQLERDLSPTDRERLELARLYYEFQVDAREGYRLYARWDYNAISSHEIGFDMRLRDEGLRFMERYSVRKSPFYDKRVAALVDRDAIDRDCAVRWVQRYLARGDFKKAYQVAKSIRYNKKELFNWESIKDPLYKAGLLTAWGEAMLYVGTGEKDTLSTLKQAIRLLSEEQGWTEEQLWWRAHILGRAYNNIGYLFWTNGRYGLALEYYRHALPYFVQSEMRDERANTLNNLAHLEALLGRVSLAEQHVTQALQIREQIGRKYPAALSHNTLGIIHTLQDHPMWGERECQKALKICEDLKEDRGIGLACNALGFALRKRGDQWKKGVYSQDEANAYFTEAFDNLQRAVEIFSHLPEPIRLWEAYNELGSLYCDWGWLARKRASDLDALGQYEESIKWQRKALAIARKHNLQYQIADSYDDLAQVLSDRSALLLKLERVKEAKQSRKEALLYLDRIDSMVPKAFRLKPKRGFRETLEPGETYWLSLGKVHLQRGIWAFRLEEDQFTGTRRDERMSNGIRHFALATAYFRRYWPQSYMFDSTLRYFGSRLREAGVPAELARKVVQKVAAKYNVDLDPLLETVDSVLGI